MSVFMCEKCQTIFDTSFPGMDEATADYILWNMTAFPMAGPEEFERQIKELQEVIKFPAKGWAARLSAEGRRQEEEMEKLLRGV